MPSFIKIVQTIKKLNSISRARLNFRRRPFCVQLCIETLCKRATSVAHLTNFSFEFFNEIFTEDASLFFLYHGAKKLKMTKNSNQRGSSLKAEGEEFNVLILSYTRELSRPFKENKGQTTMSEEQDHHVCRQTTAARPALCAHSYFDVFFPPAFVESQMTQVDRLSFLERGVLGSSSLSCGSFIVVFTFFLSKWGLWKILSLSTEWLKESLTQIKVF